MLQSRIVTLLARGYVKSEVSNSRRVLQVDSDFVRARPPQETSGGLEAEDLESCPDNDKCGRLGDLLET